MKYCVLDFDEFRLGCNLNSTDDEIPWVEMKSVFEIYDKCFPSKRIESGLQKAILEEIKIRIKKGYQWIRSKLNNKPYLLVFGTQLEPKILPHKIAKLVEIKMLMINSIIGGLHNTGDVGLDKEKVYVSQDGVINNDCEVYYFENDRELLTKLNTFYKLKDFVLENWCNVNISRGKKGFKQDSKYQLFYNMYSAIPNTPQLFGLTSINEFFKILSDNKITKVIVTDSEYYDVSLTVSLPDIIQGISTINLKRYNVLVLRVNRNFVVNTSNGINLSENYFNIICTIGCDEQGSNVIGARIILCLCLIEKILPTISTIRAVFPIALNTQYHNTCRDMMENVGKSIWIAAGKGSGKSKIVDLLHEKNFVCIDSDLYGRVLYQMAIHSNDAQVGCPYTLTDNHLVFANWIYNFSILPNFEDQPSFHELLATEFCQREGITLDMLVHNKVDYKLFRTFAKCLTIAANKFMKVQDYANLIGYIPSVIQGGTSDVVPTMIIFGHNTLELFPAMTNAIWKMEACFDTTAAVITRTRASDPISQLFLCVYYETLEPLIANALPSFLIMRCLSVLPPYIRK